MNDVKLLPLPDGYLAREFVHDTPVYDAGQMEAYARACIEADRQSRQDEVARDAARYRELRRIVLADPCAPMNVPERVVYRLLRIDKAKAGTWDAAIDKVIDVAMEATGGES